MQKKITMSATLYTFLLLIHAKDILSALPSIQKCQLSDSNCLQKSSQSILREFTAGIPEIGTETLEPLRVDLIEIDLAGLQLTLKNSNITGFSKAVIDNLNFDTSKKELELSFHLGPVTLRGKYKAGGQLLILPISGDGDITIKIKKLQTTMNMPYDILNNDNGKDFIDIKRFNFTFENKVNTHFKLTNLFGGNKILSETMHTFMNTNWNLISDQFGAPIVKKALEKIFIAIKTFLRSQPLEDIVILYN